MNFDTPDQGTAKEASLQKEAADWFVRIHTREPDCEDVIGWQRWLMADEAHRRAFAEYERLWHMIGQIQMQSAATQDPAAAQASVAPAERAWSRKWPLALAASVTIVIAATGLLSIRSAQLPASAIVQTRKAEDRNFTLPDGSRVEVGARTRLVVDFNRTTRTVILDDGEAYFEVAHETRPFIVRAGSGTITAVGTEFNVHHLDGRVAVTVVEGTVRVRDVQERTAPPAPDTAVSPTLNSAEPMHMVHAGQGVTYGRGAKQVEAIDIRLATAWRDGNLKFIREPLGFVTADVERYADVQISIADPAIAELLYTGTVIPADIDDWLALLSDALPIDVQRIDKNTVLLKLRSEQAPAHSS